MIFIEIFLTCWLLVMPNGDVLCECGEALTLPAVQVQTEQRPVDRISSSEDVGPIEALRAR